MNHMAGGGVVLKLSRMIKLIKERREGAQWQGWRRWSLFQGICSWVTECLYGPTLYGNGDQGGWWLPLRYTRSGREAFTAVEGGFSGAVRFPLEQKGEGNSMEKRVSIQESLLRMAHGFWGLGGQDKQVMESQQMCTAP